MDASLDTNVIIHLYNADFQELLSKVTTLEQNSRLFYMGHKNVRLFGRAFN